MTFRVGDMASYPARGIVEIAGVEDRTIGGVSIPLYVLRALVTDDKVLVPVEHAEARGLRALCDSGTARRLLDVLDDPGTLDVKDSANRRNRSLKERLDTGRAFETATVYRDLHRLREHKPLSFGEVRMLETARQRLATEIAHALHRGVEDITDELESHFADAA